MPPKWSDWIKKKGGKKEKSKVKLTKNNLIF